MNIGNVTNQNKQKVFLMILNQILMSYNNALIKDKICTTYHTLLQNL